MVRRISFFVTIFLFATITLQAQQAGQLLEAGPMLGYVEMQEANIWLQATQSTDFEIRYWKKGQQDSARSIGGTTDPRTSNTVQVKLENLEPGTTYNYEIHLGGNLVSFPYQTTFTTKQLWQYRTDPPNFTVAMGSCLFINDKKYDRPGEPYGKGTEILREINKQDPDIMLWLGDNVYYRSPDFYSKSRMDYRYKDARNTPDMQPLLANAINLATWDDHDYGPNNSDRSYRMREEALEIFKRYWANPSYGIQGTDGVFTRYTYSDVEFFFMDDRYHRAPNDLNKNYKDFFGQEQLQWLKDGLVSSNATFKIVVVGNQVTNRRNLHESFFSYGQEFDELMKFLSRNEVPGLLFVSGDRHFSELLKTERPEKYPLYEFTSSPLSSGSYSTLEESKEYNNPQRVEGTLVYKDQNFGMIRVTGNEDNRKLILQTYSSKGKKLWERTITENELKTQ